MGMTRGQALVATVARVVELTGRTSLENLEVGDPPELDLESLLVTASDAIYDRLTADGIDPTALINQEVFERPVAWHFLALLAAHGHIHQGGEGERSQESFDRLMELSDRYYGQFARPLLENLNSPARPREAIPVVKNMFTDPLFKTS